MANTKLTLNLVAKTQNFNKGVKDASNSLSKFGGSIQSMSKGIVTTAGNIANAIKAVVGALASTITTAIDFEHQMAKVSTMLWGQMDLFDGLSDGVRQLALDYGESTKALTDGLYQILSAQIAAKDALDVLRISNKLAIGGFTDTASAARVLVSVLKAYQLQASEAAAVAEVLSRIQWKGITTVQEMASSLGQVLTNAKTAGVSFEELGAAIATITRAGLPTAEAMTAINKAMIAMTAPSERQAEVFKDMGIQADANGAKIKDLGELMLIIADNADVTNRSIKEIFGIRGQRAINAMRAASKEFTADLIIMRQSAEKTGSIMQFMFNRMADTTTMAIRRFKAHVRDVFIRGLKDALPFLKQFFNFLSSIFKDIDTRGASSFVSGMIIVVAKLVSLLEKVASYVRYILERIQLLSQVVAAVWKEVGKKEAIRTLILGVDEGIGILHDHAKDRLGGFIDYAQKRSANMKANLGESLRNATRRFDKFMTSGFDKFQDRAGKLAKNIQYGVDLVAKRLEEAKKSPKEIRVEFENLLATMAASGEADFTIQKNRIEAIKKWLSLLREGSQEYAKVLRQLNKEQRKFFMDREKLARQAYKNEIESLKALMLTEEEIAKMRIGIIHRWIKEFKHGGSQYKKMLVDLLKAETDYFRETRDARVANIQDQVDLVDLANASEIEKLKTKAELEKKILDHFQAGTVEWWRQFKKLKQAELALEKHIREKKKKIFDLEHSEKMKKLREDIEAYKRRLHMQVGNDKQYQKTRRKLAEGEAQYDKSQFTRMTKLFQKHAGMKKSEHYNNLERARIMAEQMQNNLKKEGKLTDKKEKFLQKVQEKATKAREKLLAGLSEEERAAMRDKEELVDDAQKLEMDKIQQQVENLGKLEEKSSSVLAEIRDKVAEVMGRVGDSWEETLLGMIGKASEAADKIKAKFGEIFGGLAEKARSIFEAISQGAPVMEGSNGGLKGQGGSLLKGINKVVPQIGEQKIQINVGPISIGKIDDFLDANKAGYVIGEAVLNKTRNWRNT